MGEMTWKPPWSPGASVQQGQGAADKEEWDPGGTTVDQLTALYQAAFPAIGLILLPPWRREKQGGCKDRRILAGNPSDRPADGSDGWHLCEDPPGVPGGQWLPMLDNQRVLPSPPQRLWERPAYISRPRIRERSLYYQPLSRREVRGAVPRPEPGKSPRC